MGMWKVCRRLLWSAIPLAAAIAGSALAATDWDDPGSRRGEEKGGLSAYVGSVGNRLLIGVNSVLTFPADPVMSTLDPLEEFAELPSGAVGQYFVGLGQGALLGAYRASMGVLDIAFSAVTPLVMLSPEPRYLLFEGAEHEAY
jgi:hypothetical protein